MNVNLTHGLQQQAANWYARLSAPDCSAAERAEFERWLAADSQHVQAFIAVSGTAQQVTRQAQVDPRLKALAEAALADSAADAAKVQSAHAAQPGRIVKCIEGQWRRAAVVLVTVGVAALLATRMTEQAPQVAPVDSYANHESHEKRIQLADGSVVHLDVASQLTVRMSNESRRVELLKGRAYFEVAHDSSRPFSVVAEGTRTVALGTRFEVAIRQRAQEQSVSVTLTEGSIAVSDAINAQRWREVLRPGQQLQIRAGAQPQLREVNAEAVTGWSKGRLIFDSTPLAQALDEVNRYASIKISLGDAMLADIPIGGSFVAGGDSNEFVAALTAVLPLRSVNAGANEIVLFQKYESATH